MKRTFAAAAVAMVVFSACTNIFSPNSARDNEGVIQVTLPPIARTAAWTNSDISPYASAYEIVAYNSANHVSSGILSSTGTHSLSVPAGTYSLLVFAGKTGSVLDQLYGIGEAQSVTVVAGQTTSKSVQINTYAWTSNWPSNPVSAGSSVTVTVDLDLLTSALSIDSSASAQGWVEIGGSNHMFTWSNSSGTLWQGTTTFTAPATAGDFQLSLVGPTQLRLRDTTYGISQSLDNFTDGDWWFPSYSSFPSTTPMYSQFNRTMTTASTDPGLNVDISWGSDT